MRISPTELQAVRRAGMLTRFGLLGPVAFIMVELSESGTVGTGLDEACLTDHHGLVTRGWFAVHHADGRSETFKAGDAFYVPEGPPPHTFSGSPGCHVQGFAVVPADTDTSTEGLRALGFETADTPDPVGPPPTTVTLRGSVDPFHRTGAIEVEGSRMGPWLFMRARFGPRGGYTSGWCDLTHWGLVLEGEVAIQRSDSTELAGRGDVYHVEPGHRFTSPDGATIADYTPVASLGNARTASWRRAAVRAALEPHEAALPVSSATATVANRARLGLTAASGFIEDRSSLAGMRTSP